MLGACEGFSIGPHDMVRFMCKKVEMSGCEERGVSHLSSSNSVRQMGQILFCTCLHLRTLFTPDNAEARGYLTNDLRPRK